MVFESVEGELIWNMFRKPIGSIFKFSYVILDIILSKKHALSCFWWLFTQVQVFFEIEKTSKNIQELLKQEVFVDGSLARGR